MSPGRGFYGYLIKTDAFGNKQWEKTFGGWSDDGANCIQRTRDGNYIIAGYSGSFGDGMKDFYLVKIDASGKKLWEKALVRTGNKTDQASFVQQTRDGGYIVVGYTETLTQSGNSELDFSIYLVKLKPELSVISFPLTGQPAAEKLGKYEKGGTLIAEPVDAATGAHVIERNVLTINGAQPVSFNLNYNSLLLKEGPLGKGWSHNYETRLVKNQDGSYTLTRKDQKEYRFDSAGRLISLSNGRGKSVI
ncbi:DUF6531 domain-containing protein [Desulfofundulus thermosubterraneus]|uniref:DUF6531 domain-containing protein n=1 Tax=Desulfofundulus thermosubterraneus TaxID=348840 RepID=UPI000933C31F|nr:DUF6531 domain-containing protein [Desulfofundulus thermosubterraneus]